MSERMWKIILLALIGIAIAGAPYSFVAWGSDIETRKSSLYPFRSLIEVQDEFLSGLTSNGTAGTLGWFTSGGTTTLQGGEPGEPGILRKETTTTSATVAPLLISGIQTSMEVDSQFDMLLRGRLNTNDANTTMRIGFSNGCTVAITNGIYFEKLDGDTNWFTVTNNVGTATRNDSGVAVNTNFNYFEIKKRTGVITFWINGVLVATHTTNFPVSGYQYCDQIINSAAANKTFDHGYFQLKIYISR